MTYWITVIGGITGILFSIVGTIATVVGLVPRLRHKVVKSIAYSSEVGRMEARATRSP